MQYLVQIHGLTKSYKKTKALDNFDLDLIKGDVTGVFGKNGAGKSTLFKSLANIITPDSGELSWAEPTFNIGYLPEERGLYPQMKVTEYLHFIRRIKKSTDHREIQDYIDRLDLGGYATMKIDQLSKGNQQKVQIISAFLGKMDFIILDEPFSGLDIEFQFELEKIIEEQKSKGVTFLVSSHQLNRLKNTLDHVVVIHKGAKKLDKRIDPSERTSTYRIQYRSEDQVKEEDLSLSDHKSQLQQWIAKDQLVHLSPLNWVDEVESLLR